MRAVIGLLVAVAFPCSVFGQPVAPQATQVGRAAEQEVRQAEDARRDAILRNDTAALDYMIAASFLGTLDDGRVVKRADELAVNRASDRKVESWDATDVIIRVYGDTALVTGRAAVKDRLRDEGTRAFTFGFTHVWVKLDGRWQLVARHISGRTPPRSQPQPSTGPPNQSGETNEIVRLLREWGDAMARRDAEALGRLLADDFLFVSPRGRRIPKATYVANRDATRELNFAAQSSQFDDVSVRFHGAMAIATSRYTSKATITDAGVVQKISDEYTRTDTLIKKNGRWQAVATQLTPIGYSGAHAASDAAALQGLTANDLKWEDSAMYPGSRVAVLHGIPYTGGYTIRMRRSNAHFEKPHYHESDEHLSVLSGVVHIGVGEGSNRATARTFRAGAYVVIPARTLHYSWAEGDVVAEVHWSGPAAALYVGGPR